MYIKQPLTCYVYICLCVYIHIYCTYIYTHTYTYVKSYFQCEMWVADNGEPAGKLPAASLRWNICFTSYNCAWPVILIWLWFPGGSTEGCRSNCFWTPVVRNAPCQKYVKLAEWQPERYQQNTAKTAHRFCSEKLVIQLQFCSAVICFQ